MTAVAGKVVALTGAGSGIGRALALHLAGQGSTLAVSDRNADGLAETERLVRATHPGATLRADHVDVSDEGAVREWAETVAGDFGRVNIVVNNAGVAFSGDITESTLKDLDWVMGVNFWGVVHGTTAFLPHLTASGEGHVVNLSSLFGLIAMPSQSAYVAAKFAVRGWSETLREELLLAKAPVKVSVVHPGGVKTGIAQNARAADGIDPKALANHFDAKMAKMSPAKAAQIIVTGVERNRPRILVGSDAKALDVLQRLVGARYEDVIAFGARWASPVAKARRAR